MPKPLRILVSGASGDVAQGVLKALDKANLDIELFTTCIFADSAFLHRYPNSYLAPRSSSAEYIPFLVHFLNRFQISLFIPGVDSEQLRIARHRSLLESQTSALVMSGSVEQLSICNDKVATAQFLEAEGFVHPRTIGADDPLAEDFLQSLAYPVVVKPRSGRASENVFVKHCLDDLRPYLGDSSYCFQEWLTPDLGEYTSGIYLGDDGEVKGLCTLRRELRGGATYKASRVISPQLEEPLKEMARRLGLKYLNIQSRMKDGVLCPFEFNGRFSGTTGIISRVFNAPEMLVREWLLKECIEATDSKETFVVMRFFEEVFTTPEAIEQLIERSKQLGPDPTL